jgi:hypothetical protein
MAGWQTFLCGRSGNFKRRRIQARNPERSPDLPIVLLSATSPKKGDPFLIRWKREVKSKNKNNLSNRLGVVCSS